MRPTRMIGFFNPHQHHERHLQQDLELLHHVVRRGFVEVLGAVAALQQKRLAALRCRELRLQILDFPRRHERRQLRQLREHGFEMDAVAIRRLLRGRPTLPAGRVPIGWSACLSHRRLDFASSVTIPAGSRRGQKKPGETGRNMARLEELATASVQVSP